VPWVARLTDSLCRWAACRNEVAESIESFDRVIELDRRRSPYMWQRGLSLYYAERHTEAMSQFEEDVAVNPNDTEESIWHWLAHVRLLRAQGQHSEAAIAEARAGLLKVGTDSRPVMRSAMELFAGRAYDGDDDGAVAALDAAGGLRTSDGRAQHDRFCAHSPSCACFRSFTSILPIRSRSFCVHVRRR
jgi:tetratricopeptide (TPR) repeat protein